MKIKNVLPTLLIILLSSPLAAQTQVIELWDGQVPGSIEQSDYQQTVDDNDGWVKMRFVTNPSLDVYPAPAEIATGSAVVVCPGGGYWLLAIDHEGAQIASWLNSLGISAFVLKYRLPDDAIMEDSITHLGSRTLLLGDFPSPEKVVHFSNEMQVTQDTPPAFIIHSMDDGAVTVQNSLRYAMALREHTVPCELHLYQSGGHGYGLGRSGNSECSWPEACEQWLGMNGF